MINNLKIDYFFRTREIALEEGAYDRSKPFIVVQVFSPGHCSFNGKYYFGHYLIVDAYGDNRIKARYNMVKREIREETNAEVLRILGKK
jgi:hypothetical protein